MRALLSVRAIRRAKLSIARYVAARGKREKNGAVYTADFRVTYIDGYQEVIDVKGWLVARGFPLRRRLFELKTGMELIVVRLIGKEWVSE